MAHRSSRSGPSARPERTEEPVRPVTPAPSVSPPRRTPTGPLGPPPAQPPPPPPSQPARPHRAVTYSLFPKIEPLSINQAIQSPSRPLTPAAGPSRQSIGSEQSSLSPSSSQSTLSPPAEWLSPERPARTTPRIPTEQARPPRPDEPLQSMRTTSTERSIPRRPARPEDRRAVIAVPNFSRQIPEITTPMLAGIVKEQNRSLRHCHKSITDLKHQNQQLSRSDQDLRSKYQQLQAQTQDAEDAYDDLYHDTKRKLAVLMQYGDLQRDIVRIVMRRREVLDGLKGDAEWKAAVEGLDEFFRENWRVMGELYPGRQPEVGNGDGERAFVVWGVLPGS